MPEVEDVGVLHGCPLRLPLGCEGDTGSPLVHGLATRGLTGGHPEQHVRGHQSVTMLHKVKTIVKLSLSRSSNIKSQK